MSHHCRKEGKDSRLCCLKSKGIVQKVAELECKDYDFDGVETQHRDQSYDSNWYGYDD